MYYEISEFDILILNKLKFLQQFSMEFQESYLKIHETMLLLWTLNKSSKKTSGKFSCINCNSILLDYFYEWSRLIDRDRDRERLYYHVKVF